MFVFLFLLGCSPRIDSVQFAFFHIYAMLLAIEARTQGTRSYFTAGILEYVMLASLMGSGGVQDFP